EQRHRGHLVARRREQRRVPCDGAEAARSRREVAAHSECPGRGARQLRGRRRCARCQQNEHERGPGDRVSHPHQSPPTSKVIRTSASSVRKRGGTLPGPSTPVTVISTLPPRNSSMGSRSIRTI